jgi:hypothetical protein
MEEEFDERAITSLIGLRPLSLLDLRITGANRLGISMNVPRGKAQGPGPRFSARLCDQTSVDGIIYHSTITDDECIAVYDRAAVKLDPQCPVVDLLSVGALTSVLHELDIKIIARVSRQHLAARCSSRLANIGTVLGSKTPWIGSWSWRETFPETNRISPA